MDRRLSIAIGSHELPPRTQRHVNSVTKPIGNGRWLSLHAKQLYEFRDDRFAPSIYASVPNVAPPAHSASTTSNGMATQPSGTANAARAASSIATDAVQNSQVSAAGYVESEASFYQEKAASHVEGQCAQRRSTMASRKHHQLQGYLE